MKTRKQLFILIVITLLTFSSASFAQGPHVVTLHIDTNELNNSNEDAAFSFSASTGTAVENIDDPENFTITVNVDDEIEWVGTSSSGAAVGIDEIEIVADETTPDRDKIFRKNKMSGRINDGKKKVKAKVKDRSKGNTYKYIIRFSIGASSFAIDPKIKVP